MITNLKTLVWTIYTTHGSFSSLCGIIFLFVSSVVWYSYYYLFETKEYRWVNETKKKHHSPQIWDELCVVKLWKREKMLGKDWENVFPKIVPGSIKTLCLNFLIENNFLSQKNWNKNCWVCRKQIVIIWKKENLNFEFN